MRAAIQKLPAPQRSSFIYQRKSSSNFEFNWHFHPEYELTLIVKSRGRRFVADSISDYQNGDLVLLGPKLPHTWQSFSEPDQQRGRHQACIIQFRDNFLGESFFDSRELRQVKGMLKRSDHGLHFTGRARDEASKRIVALNQLFGMQRLTAFLEILDLLARSRKAALISSPGFVPSLHHANHQRIDCVCQYINENYMHNISQPQVASLVQMNSSAFSSFFKKTVGLTFVEYVNNLRLSLACRLLIESDHSILNICHQAGFNNLSNFNRQFLKSKEMSPRQYRKSFLQSGR
jgi:AraC-like DNA-binding protein